MSLCRIEIDVPRQFRSTNDWDIHVDIWFPPQQLSVTIEDEVRILRYGFKQVVFELGTKQKLTMKNHLEVEAPSVEFQVTASNNDKQKWTAGGKLGFNVWKFFGLNFGGTRENQSDQADKRSEKRIEKRYVLQSIDHHIWLISGYNCPNGVLTGKVVNAEPLCRIPDVDDQIDFRAKVTAPLNQLWTGIVDDAGALMPDNDQSNRMAVVRSVIAKSLRRRLEAEFDRPEPSETQLWNKGRCIKRNYSDDG